MTHTGDFRGFGKFFRFDNAAPAGQIVDAEASDGRIVAVAVEPTPRRDGRFWGRVQGANEPRGANWDEREEIAAAQGNPGYH